MTTPIQSKLLTILDAAKAGLTPEQILDPTFDYAELDIKFDLHLEQIHGHIHFDIECDRITHIFQEEKGVYMVRLSPVQFPEFELDITYKTGVAEVKLYGQDRWCVVTTLIPLR